MGACKRRVSARVAVVGADETMLKLKGEKAVPGSWWTRQAVGWWA